MNADVDLLMSLANGNWSASGVQHFEALGAAFALATRYTFALPEDDIQLLLTACRQYEAKCVTERGVAWSSWWAEAWLTCRAAMLDFCVRAAARNDEHANYLRDLASKCARTMIDSAIKTRKAAAAEAAGRFSAVHTMC